MLSTTLLLSCLRSTIKDHLNPLHPGQTPAQKYLSNILQRNKKMIEGHYTDLTRPQIQLEFEEDAKEEKSNLLISVLNQVDSEYFRFVLCGQNKKNSCRSETFIGQFYTIAGLPLDRYQIYLSSCYKNQGRERCGEEALAYGRKVVAPMPFIYPGSDDKNDAAASREWEDITSQLLSLIEQAKERLQNHDFNKHFASDQQVLKIALEQFVILSKMQILEVLRSELFLEISDNYIYAINHRSDFRNTENIAYFHGLLLIFVPAMVYVLNENRSPHRLNSSLREWEAMEFNEKKFITKWMRKQVSMEAVIGRSELSALSMYLLDYLSVLQGKGLASMDEKGHSDALSLLSEAGDIVEKIMRLNKSQKG